MFAPWRLFASVKVLQHLRSVTILMALAILLVIAIIAVVAKIAYEDRSWVAIFFLVVTIVQVLKSTLFSPFSYSHGGTSTWLGCSFQVVI